MWELGRQGGGYFKWIVFATKWFDCVLIKFPHGSSINKHTDPCDYGKHHRINITLRKPESGGEFSCKGDPILRLPRFVLFRPDIQIHEVTPVIGKRLILSFGFVIPN
jgi:hypothetical protein